MEGEGQDIARKEAQDSPLLQNGLQRHPSRPSYFLGMPEELRRLIYRQLMTTHWPPFLQIDSIERTRPVHTFSTALLRICRFIHDEASIYFYSHLTWRTHLGLYEAPRMPAMLVPSYSHMISHLEMSILLLPLDDRSSLDNLKEVSKQLSKGGRIKTLEIHTVATDVRVDGIHSCLQGLAPLADRVDEIIIGQLTIDPADKLSNRSRDKEAYHHLKEIFYRVKKWSFPYSDHQYKD